MASEDRFPTINIEEQIQLASQIGPPMEPYELVELLYNDSQIPHSSNIQPSAEVPVEAKKAAEYKCNVCHRSFKEASHFTNHKRGTQCHKSLQGKNSFKKSKVSKSCVDKRRKISLAPFKPYQCNLCGARFCDKGNVQLHLQKIHQSNEQLWSEFSKPSGFACSLCDFWFSDKDQLKTHQQQHNACVTTSFNDVSQQNGGGQAFYSGGLSEDSFMYVNPSNNPYSSSDLHQNSINSSLEGPLTIPNSMSLNHGYSPQNQYGCSYVNNSPIQTSHPTMPSNSAKKSDSIEKSSNTKWHTCSYCELKFIDPINLELHIKRKHSSLQSGGAGSSTALECTTAFPTCASNSSSSAWKVDRKSKPCVCNICGAKVGAMSNMVSHLKTEHATADSDVGQFVSVQKRKLNSWKTVIDVEAKCDHCLTTFTSSESMLNHKNNEKFVFCGVCDFLSCSETQVAIHIYSVHNEHLPGSSASKPLTGDEANSSLSEHRGNSCYVCDFVADTGCALVQHLEYHGTGKFQCVKCSEVSSSYELICHHLHTSHINQIAKIKVSVEGANDITVFLTPDLVTAAAIKHNPPANAGHATHSAKKVKLSANEIDLFICSSCCISMKSDKLKEHLLLHQKNGISEYNNCQSVEDDRCRYSSLWRETATVEFACSDCGFARKTPQAVINHIQVVHLSGKLVHVKKGDKNKLESIVSNVFTPPSIIN